MTALRIVDRSVVLGGVRAMPGVRAAPAARRASRVLRCSRHATGRLRHRRHAGELAADLYPALAPAYPRPAPGPLRRRPTPPALDLVFSALPNGPAQRLVPDLLPKVGHVVDLAADFRLRDAAALPASSTAGSTRRPSCWPRRRSGIPELFRRSIAGARLVAAPGCYVTAAALALAPFVRAGAIEPTGVIVDAASGVSGRGQGKHPFGDGRRGLHRLRAARPSPHPGDGAGHRRPRSCSPRTWRR